MISALLAGNRNNNGNFNNLGNNANYWSSTENNATNANNLNLNNNDSNINFNNNNKENGFSVRCVQDSNISNKNTVNICCSSYFNMNDQLTEDLFTAYFSARKNKRNTLNALAFEINYESKLFELAEDIKSRNYEISPSICFINFEPVQREIFAAGFRDRVVHHLLFNYINKVFDNTFINDSYSCRKNRGTFYGIKQINRFISQCSSNYTKDCFIMKLDIEGYFMGIDRELLYNIILTELHKIDRKDFDLKLVDYLLQNIVFNDPTINCKLRGKKSDWKGLPPSKSLFDADKGKGLPIGNLTSQLFGNIYLNSLDHFIKKELGIMYYGRYVDDFVLIHPDKNYLIFCHQKIDKFLKDRLMLKLHPRKFYLQHYQKGVSFLGVLIKPYRIYIGKRTKKNFVASLNKCKNFLGNEILYNDIMDFRNSVNSYLGYLKHWQTFALRKKNMNKNRTINNHFVVDEMLSKIIFK